MKTRSRSNLWALLVGALVLGLGLEVSLAQGAAPPDQPSVTVRGQTYTPRSILARNMGSPEDQTTAFPPHKIVGNVYYVGTRTLTSFLITTPQGHILINSTYERNVRTIEKSVTAAWVQVLGHPHSAGTHAHDDHQEGDALLKELTGAQVMVMQEDCLRFRRSSLAERPIRSTAAARRRGGHAGGTTLVAHLTPGHTHGATTWTMKATEGGRTYNVVFATSYRSPTTVSPDVENEFNRTFTFIRTLSCDVPLGDHAAQYNLNDKYAR